MDLSSLLEADALTFLDKGKVQEMLDNVSIISDVLSQYEEYYSQGETAEEFQYALEQKLPWYQRSDRLRDARAGMESSQGKSRYQENQEAMAEESARLRKKWEGSLNPYLYGSGGYQPNEHYNMVGQEQAEDYFDLASMAQEKVWMDTVAKYTGKEFKDNFWGQFGANYTMGRLGQDSSMAWNKYLDDPTEQNRRDAETIDQLITEIQLNNEDTLADDGTLPWISKALANYIPQFLDQMKYSGSLGAVGALTGNPKGVKAGIVMGSGVYSYMTMRGAAFKSLLEAGIPEEQARAAAKDEAVVSSLIEMGDTAIDLATLGGGKLINVLTAGSLDAIKNQIAKYNLKPAGSNLEFRTVQNLCDALGIERIQKCANGMTLIASDGRARSSGNFDLTMNFTFPKDTENEMNSTWGVLSWNWKDCFSPDSVEIEDTGDWKEWNYKTASGRNVLIMRSPSDWRGWILCDRGDAMLSLRVEARQDLAYNVDGKSWFEYKYITDKQMEQIADAVDFGIQPKKVSQENAANQPVPPQEATQDGYTVTLKDIFTDGYTLQVTLGIAAPEGTAIAGETQPGANPDGEFTIMWDNIPSLTHPTRKAGAGDCEWEMQEDGDGKNNTHDLVFEVNTLMQDNEASFVPGETWKLHIEDLKTSFLDKEALAHGEWNFEIPITEDNGDFRELELAPEPITTKVSTGWLPDGTDVMENVKISSFKLHTLGAIYETDSDHMVDFCPSSEENPVVVMKDGSKVDLRLGGGGAMLVTDTPIDLDQVDYVELIDGTKLPVPQSGENQ